MHFLNVEAFTVSQLLNHQVIWAPPSHRLNPALGGVLRNGSIRTRFLRKRLRIRLRINGNVRLETRQLYPHIAHH